LRHGFRALHEQDNVVGGDGFFDLICDSHGDVFRLMREFSRKFEQIFRKI